MSDELSYLVVADAYKQEAKTILEHSGMDTFNISSHLDSGGSYLKLNPINMITLDHPATGATGTVFFVLGHSIELYLKSILLERGFDKEALKNLGHNLSKIVSEVEKDGTIIPGRNEIFKFSESHRTLEYRYPENARIKVVNPALLLDVTHKLSDLVHNEINC